MTVFVDGSGLTAISDFVLSRFPNAVKRAMQLSVNDTARDALKLGGDAMRKQVRFPDDYLNQPERFWISQFATADNAEAHITARSRATSLRRFAVGDPTPDSTRGHGGKGQQALGIQVEVRPGNVINFRSGFVIPLRPVAEMGGVNYGIAVKLKAGQVPPIKKSVFSEAQLGHAYYILYGPSVDQVFKGVAKDIAPEVTSRLDAEFQRQLYVQIGK